jgi:glutathione synthase/RimK-type ligase-like ATP-grasp enzyme
MKLRVATCMTLPEPDVDQAPLAAALDRAGVTHSLLAWDDPHVDWDAPVPTIIRSTWNYVHDIDAYLAWVDRTAAAAPLWNPPAIVRGNVNKRYLLELARRGVPVVPTTLVERGGAIEPPRERVVIKPEVGAGSVNTRVFAAGDREAIAHCAAITARGAALVQPYLASVDDYGERSLVWIDGELSHAIRKSPRFTGDAETVTGPFPIAPEEREVALAALAPVADQILYGRVDLARDPKGQPVVMELELVEPSLFFAHHPPAADRFVMALLRRLLHGA